MLLLVRFCPPGPSFQDCVSSFNLNSQEGVEIYSRFFNIDQFQEDCLSNPGNPLKEVGYLSPVSSC
jgi:hypothetical protein